MGMKKYFIEEFKDLSEEKIKIIGISIFGNALNFLKSNKPDVIKLFEEKFGKTEPTKEREIFKYISENYLQYTDPDGNVYGSSEKPSLIQSLRDIKAIRNQ